MSLKGTRAADHAGSWYTDNAVDLSKELDLYLNQVPPTIHGHELPIPNARAVIAP